LAPITRNVISTGHRNHQGVFGGKKALLSLTTGGGPEHYRIGGFNGDIESILRPIQRGMLYFVGFEVLRPHISWGPAHATERERESALINFQKRLHSVDLEPPYDVGQY
jgi:NAD(P)H dehydrogenase (quinone)